MKVFYSEVHRQHSPPFEVFDGGKRVPYLENPNRMDRILSALRREEWAEIIEPSEFGLEPIRAVHDAGYLDFLASCWDEWLASDPGADVSPEESAFLPATFALRRQPPIPKSFLGRAGYYIMDLSAVIVKGTYLAALSSAYCALSGAQAISNGDRVAFALCRPPGHHAGRDYAGGYCFINNAAVAAEWLSTKGRTAILDIDYHAGNGTQDIFYSRADVLTISIHGDPDYEYPHYAGYAHETGEGRGKRFHRNLPLPAGTEDAQYLAALDAALQLIKDFSPRRLVVSAGMDLYREDPLGTFKVSSDGIHEIGKRIRALELPSLVVMEGGYNNEELGRNTVLLLDALR